MAESVYAIEVSERTIPEAVAGKPFRKHWRYYRLRWVAKFVVWRINVLGAGLFYERARFLGETL